MKQRNPEQVIKLYDRLWRRANNGNYPPFAKLKTNTLTGRCIMLLRPQRAVIREAMNSRAYREAVSKIIHSN